MEEILTNQDNDAAPNEAVGIIGQVYNSLAIKGTSNFSKGFGKIFELVSSIQSPWLSSDENSAKKQLFKKNLSALKEKIDVIPEDKVCESPTEIGVPIMEKLTYVTNEQIRDAYINLLSKSVSEDTANLAHPAFEGLIGRLSADEAKIIDFLKAKQFVPFINYKLNTEGNGFITKKKFATGIEYDLTLDFPSNIDVYVTNLLNMGILSYTPGLHKKSEEVYKPLFDQYKYFELQLNLEIEQTTKLLSFPLPEEFKRNIERLIDFEHEKGYFEITPFGKLFIEACTSAKP